MTLEPKINFRKIARNFKERIKFMNKIPKENVAFSK